MSMSCHVGLLDLSSAVWSDGSARAEEPTLLQHLHPDRAHLLLRHRCQRRQRVHLALREPRSVWSQTTARVRVTRRCAWQQQSRSQPQPSKASDQTVAALTSAEVDAAQPFLHGGGCRPGRARCAPQHTDACQIRSGPATCGGEVSAAAHSRRSRAACAEGICWRLQQTRERVRKTHRVPPASGSCLGKQATASTETEKESNMDRLAHRTMAERTRQTSVATSERRRTAPTLRTAAATTETPAPQNTQPAVNTNSQTMQPAAAAV